LLKVSWFSSNYHLLLLYFSITLPPWLQHYIVLLKYNKTISVNRSTEFKETREHSCVEIQNQKAARHFKIN